MKLRNEKLPEPISKQNEKNHLALIRVTIYRRSPKSQCIAPAAKESIFEGDSLRERFCESKEKKKKKKPAAIVSTSTVADQSECNQLGLNQEIT